MLRYLYADQLQHFPRLRSTMFRHRAAQFKERLGWDVSVDDAGFERDAYDDLNPLYVIWQQPDGTHGGSMRFLPTTGRTMVNEHFADITDGVHIKSARIWECTRFCLAPNASAHVAGALMLGGGELMDRFGLEHFVGVFDARMVRIYGRIGAKPTVLGSVGTGRAKISVGLWEFTVDAKRLVADRAGIPLPLSAEWFEASFGAPHGAMVQSA